jgi:protein required for attachment to host cells
MKEVNWMIVANGTCMKLYKFLADKQVLEHPEVVLHPGSRQTEDPHNELWHKSEAGHDHRMHEEKKFAKELSHYLKKAHEMKEFSHLYVAASPAFLGLLRSELPKEVESAIYEQVSKDLTKLNGKEIWKHFPSHQL